MSFICFLTSRTNFFFFFYHAPSIQGGRGACWRRTELLFVFMNTRIRGVKRKRGHVFNTDITRWRLSLLLTQETLQAVNSVCINSILKYKFLNYLLAVNDRVGQLASVLLLLQGSTVLKALLHCPRFV